MSVKNNLLYGCMRCIIYGASRDTTLIGSYNCSAVNTSGLVAINCSAMVFDSTMSGRTYNRNARVLGNEWVTLTNSIASALAPYVMSGANGNKYKVNTTGGSVYVQLDVVALKNESINLKVTNATNTIVLSTFANTETIDGNALPYTITAALYDNYVISSDGTNFYVL